MRFLIDENLSPRVAELLVDSNHDAVHVRDTVLGSSLDSEILDQATNDKRIIVTADTDFGALLAHSRASRPSVILVRALVERRPAELVGILLANLERIQNDLDRGAIVAFTSSDIRVRMLPLL